MALGCCVVGLAQDHIITGVVREDGSEEGIAAATVTAFGLPDSTIVAFDVTDAAGAYRLALPVRHDSVRVRVAHLRYAAQEGTLAARVGRRDWVLAEASIVLPEATVRKAAVERRGDTLSFDVARLRQARDQSIEDLLRRIPGVTVAPNGAIAYQGLPISKFYIEGLDLLEGQYAVATRNLAIDAIRDIEVLERHQAIRALDSLVRPPNAAINLRLKSRVALAAKAEAGAGVTPGLYEATATGFGFAKAQQASALASANNVGLEIGAQFENLYRARTPELPLVAPTQPLPPLLAPATNYRENNERAAGVNYLHRLGVHTQLKAHAALLREELYVGGRNRLTLRGLDTAVFFDEHIRSRSAHKRTRGGIVYEVNRSKLYLRADTRIDSRAASLLADNEVNGTPLAERFDDPELRAETTLSAIVRRGRAAYRIDGYARYRRRDYRLLLSPLRLAVPGEPGRQLALGLQGARVATLEADLHTGSVWRGGALRAQVVAGVRYRVVDLESDLSSLGEGSAEPGDLGLGFRNDNRTRALSPYVDAELRHERGAAQWVLTLPVAITHLAYEGAGGSLDLRRAIPTLRPRLAHRRDLGTSRWLSVEYELGRDYDRERLLYEGFVLVRNRQLDRRLPTVNQWRRHELGFRLVDSRPGRAVRHEARATASTQTEDQLATTSFDDRGETTRWTAGRNTRYQFGGHYALAFAGTRPWRFELVGSYTLSLVPTRINGRRSSVTTQVVTLEPQIDYAFGEASAVVLRPKLTTYANSLSGRLAWQSDSEAELYHRLRGAAGALRAKLYYNLSLGGDRASHNLLANLSYERSFGREASKWQLRVHVDNILAVREYVTFTQRSYADELASFRLRRRQLRAVLSKSF